MSDKYGVQNDPYCWPGTTVLTNELGIREEARLADAEAEFAAVALERIEIWPAERFDAQEAPKLDDINLLLDGHKGLPTGTA